MRRFLLLLTFQLSLSAARVFAIDLDHDGMNDLWEANYSVPSADANADYDGIGLINIQKSQLGLDPRNPNSRLNLTITHDTANNQLQLLIDTIYGKLYQIETSLDGYNWSPLGNQIQGTGGSVAVITTMPASSVVPLFRYKYVSDVDSDGDGLTAWEEQQIGTLDSNPDYDSDGLPDGWEYTYGLNPKVKDANVDSDGDGFTNLQEYQNGTNPMQSDANPLTGYVDSDGDGLPDILEAGPGADFPALPALPAARTNFSGQIQVRVLIDKTDELHIKGNQMWLKHLHGDQNSKPGDLPGWGGVSFTMPTLATAPGETLVTGYGWPTFVNGSVSWYPRWWGSGDNIYYQVPQNAFTVIYLPGEDRQIDGGISDPLTFTPQTYVPAPGDKRIYTNLAPTALPRLDPGFMDYVVRMDSDGHTTDGNGTMVSIRGTVGIKQLPAAANDYEAVLEVKDSAGQWQWMEFTFNWKSKFTFTNWKNDAQHVNSQDTDGDGLTDGQEVLTYNTDPNNYDTNHDGLTDGLEIQYGLDPLGPPPSLINPNPIEDIIGFGLDPTTTDTDHDGVDDATEIAQGSDPTDPSDHGQPPPSDERLDLRLTIGAGEENQQGQEADFQSYHMKVTDVASGSEVVDFYSHGTDGLNKNVRVFSQFRKGKAYRVEIFNQQPEGSPSKDFDYTAKVEAVNSQDHLGVDDPNGILGSHEQDQVNDNGFPQAGQAATVLTAALTKASVRDGQFVATIPASGTASTGSVDLMLGQRGSSNTVVLKHLDNQPAGVVTISLDDVMNVDTGCPLDSQDHTIFDRAVVRWHIGNIDVLSSDRVLDVPSIEVLAQRTISNYFSPTWGGVWIGTTLQKGVYPAGQFPSGLYNVDRQTDFLNAIDPQNEGLAMDGSTVIRVQVRPAQSGFPQYIFLNGTDSGYIEFPDRDQRNTASNSTVSFLRATSVAVRNDADRLSYQTADQVYIPGFSVRTVDDAGTLEGNTHQIDVWRGQGDSSLQAAVFGFGMKTRTCLKILAP